jgi:hypothetical protein
MQGIVVGTAKVVVVCWGPVELVVCGPPPDVVVVQNGRVVEVVV